MRGAKLRRPFGGICRGGSLPIDLTKAAQREAVRRDKGPSLERRVNGAKEEEAVLYDRTATFDARVARPRRDGVDRPIDSLVLLPVGLEAARLRIAECGAPQVVRAALGDHVDDAACGLAVLGAVATGLDL